MIKLGSLAYRATATGEHVFTHTALSDSIHNLGVYLDSNEILPSSSKNKLIKQANIDVFEDS